MLYTLTNSISPDVAAAKTTPRPFGCAKPSFLSDFIRKTLDLPHFGCHKFGVWALRFRARCYAHTKYLYAHTVRNAMAVSMFS
jgi:hypothetical protein